MNVSWPPCSAQIQPFSRLPEEAEPPLSAALACSPLLSSSTRHIRQLFCFDDSIIYFSGISIGIIVLIPAFVLKKLPNKFKTAAL